MQCEMCGKDFPKLRAYSVDGVKMQLCGGCGKFGTPLGGDPAQAPVTRQTVGDRLEARGRRMSGGKDVLASGEKELVDDYGRRIQRARERQKMSREQLADKVGQPVPTIAKIEGNQLHPSDRAVKAFEKALGISLMEEVVSDTIQRHGSAPSRGLTLGDLIKDAKEKAK